MSRVTKLGTWITAQLAATPEGATVQHLTALAARDFHPKPTTVDVALQLHVLELEGRAKPGPWLMTDGTPEPSNGAGRNVRRWTTTRPTISLVKDTDP